MLKKLKNWIAIILAIAVVFLSLLAILSIWGIINSEITSKLLGTLAIILSASAIFLIIIRIIEKNEN
ncbi:MAG: hypothetical protein GWO79_00990 [Actinobacteria bacterium]|nr:hypothetical protein [Actinomycetota bacterium]